MIKRLLIVILVFIVLVPSVRGEQLVWSQLPDIPDEYGFAGMFTGVHNDALILAGGSNIPEQTWGEGDKAFYDRIRVLEPGDESWREAGQLPYAAATGVSGSTPWGVIVAGGVNAERGHADVNLISWDVQAKAVSITALPPMPEPRGQCIGGIVDNALYVACGAPAHGERGFTNTLFRLQLPDPAEAAPNWNALEWEMLEPLPGPPRALPAGCAAHGKLYVISGYIAHHGEDGTVLRDYMSDAYAFTPGKGWARLADLPRPALAAPAIGYGDAHIILFGGHDGENMDQIPILKGNWPGFRRDVLAYHDITDTWTTLGEMPDLSSVKANPVQWQGRIVIPNGEVKARIRTPRVLTVEVAPAVRSFGWVNTTVLAVYLGALLVMGGYFARREKSTEDYFLGGRRVPWWAAGISIFGTQLSSIAFMAIPAKVYATDWLYFVGVICIVLVQPIIVWFYLPFFRRQNITSAYEYLEARFNLVIRLFGSASFILYQVGRMTVVLLLPSLALSAVTGFDVMLCILLMGVLATVYTYLGGIEAVVWTDVMQVFVLIGGALVSLGVILHHVGGFGELFTVAQADEKFRYVQWGWDYTEPVLWVLFVGWMFGNMVSYSADQAVIQRYLVTKDEKSAANAIWTNAALNIPVALIWYFLGTSLYVFYKMHPDMIDPTLKTDQVFPLFIAQRLPVGVTGLLIAGLFAASMSTIDSSLNSIATAVTTDFVKRLRKGASDGARDLKLARAITIVTGVGATGLALWLAARGGAPSLWDLMIVVLGLLMSSLTGLFMLGIFTRRASSAGAIVGAAAGVVALVAVQRTDVNFFLYTAVGIVACVVVGYVVSLIVPPRTPVDVNLTAFSLRRGS